MTPPTPTLWHRLARFKPAVIVVAAVWLGVEWVRNIMGTGSDFPNHWEQGLRLLRGQPIYAGGVNIVYPPFWALFHLPPALLPSSSFARGLVYPLVVVWIWLLTRSVRRVSRLEPLDHDRAFWVTTLALVLASQYVARDLMEVGVNTMLVALSWCAVDLWSRRRDAAAGWTLGFAAALKCTPLLFVAYFAWRRQWRCVAWATVAWLVFTASPILVEGPARFGRDITAWAGVVKAGLLEPDPSRGVLGEENVNALSLKPALARYLMELPYGHHGRPEPWGADDKPNVPPDPLYIHALRLSPEAAGWIVRGVLLAGALGVWWALRRPLNGRDDPAIAWECAAVSILILLLSPVSWKQHWVGVLPAMWLISRRIAVGPILCRGFWPAFWFFVVTNVLLNRSTLPLRWANLLDAYHLKTFGLIPVLVLVLTWRRWATPPGAPQTGTASASPPRAATAPPPR